MSNPNGTAAQRHHVLKSLQTLNRVPKLHLAMPGIRIWEGATCQLGVKSQWHTAKSNSRSKAEPSIETASPACVLEQSQVKFNRVQKIPEKVPEKVGEALVQSQVRFFNRVPEKVPEKVWEALVQSQVKFNGVPEKVLEKVPEKVWEALVQSQVEFNRILEKVPEKVWEGLV